MDPSFYSSSKTRQEFRAFLNCNLKALSSFFPFYSLYLRVSLLQSIDGHHLIPSPPPPLLIVPTRAVKMTPAPHPFTATANSVGPYR